MSETHRETVAGWFWPAASAALLFELLGGYMFLSQMSVDPALLEPDQRLMWEAAPVWMLVAYGVAVVTGILGAVLLLLKRRLSEALLGVSLLAAIVQFSALVVVADLRNLVAADDLFVPTVILLACYGIWQLARTARKRGWLA
jgi:hypothetical protein